MKKEQYLLGLVCLLLLCASACTKRSTAEKELLELTSVIPMPVSTENTDAAEPSIAAAGDGSVYVVWVEHRPEGQADVFLRKVNPNQSLGAPVRINPEKGNATAWRGDPPTVAVAPDGAVFVGWTAKAAAKGHENNLYLSVSRDDGATFGKPVKINDDEKPAVHGMHSLAIDKQGHIFIAWLDERNLSPAAPMEKHRGEAHAMERNREVFVAYSEDGGRTISRNQQIAKDACPCCKTAVTTAPDGKVYVGWRQVLKGDLRHIAVASSMDIGRTFSPSVIVSDDRWVIAGCPVSGPALSAGDNGNLNVLWYTNGAAGTQGLYVTRSTDGGRTFSARQLVSAGQVFGNPSLLSDSKSDHLVALWQGGENGLMRADVMPDGGVMNAVSVTIDGKLPSATLVNGRSALAYISSLNNQRSIWLVFEKKDEKTAKL